MVSTNDAAPELAATSPPQPSTSVVEGHPEPLSKNARKKLLKAERYAAFKVERRAREKEMRHERAAKRREERADPDADPAERPAKRRKVAGLGRKVIFRARVVVDLAFDDLMTEKEVVSLCSQLAYTYSSNRKSRTPFQSLLYTTLNGKTLVRLNGLGDQYKRWQHVEFWEEGYESLWTPQSSEEKRQTCSQDSVVYLTGDAEEELEELKEGETYIIGGICDHNRYKNLCLNKAKDQSIRAARLPIGTYLQDLPTRKILTVNQVFDILLHWVETRDWEKALYAVMPKRKFQQGSQKGSSVLGEKEDAESNGAEKSDVGAELNASTEVGNAVSEEIGADNE
ncbi:hypothetical protein K439DRAFT_1643757 [Ramaria rubella]|nr:hypothetical protein K439DRAFT_1643757 [Ramaria rubella]